MKTSELVAYGKQDARNPHVRLRVKNACHVAAFWACVSTAAWAGSNITDAFERQVPRFLSGSEFPGATGAVHRADGELLLDFDFSNGGHYVGATFDFTALRSVVRQIQFEAVCPDGTFVTLRTTDATGQCFQYSYHGDAGDPETFVCCVGRTRSYWGGAKDGVFHQPLRHLTVLADNSTPDMKGGPKGTMRFRLLNTSDKAPQWYGTAKRPDVPFDRLVDEAGRLRDDLARELPALERRGLGAKTRATLAVMNDFFPWLMLDVVRGYTNRALRATWEMVDIGRAAKARLENVRAGKEWDQPVPHFVTSPTRTSHAQIVGTREWPDGRREEGNVFLTGFGHFGMIQRELAKMPPLGNHILQMEIGPRSFLPREGVVNTNAIRPFIETAERAVKENVQICLLLSPHYFPEWAMKKWPYLGDCAGGFFKYCVYDPNARAVIEKSLRTVIPLIRGNPALHSVCLSNEPECGHFGKCRVMAREWPRWLARTYGSVAQMNAAWQSDYASFASVAVPSNFHYIAASPEGVAFVRFSRESFAGFHRWMAGIVHEMAPEIPVHAKIMIQCSFGANATYSSVDVGAFSELSDYNGNDACDWPLLGSPHGWAHEWWATEAGYDYQRSVKDVPVFNTENHNIKDRESAAISGRHIYTALWQNAMHGQTATTEWLWERAYDNGKADANGLFLERPGCLEAWAHCALDLNRLADVIAPIQNLPPAILLHFSVSSQVREGRRGQRFLKWYRAANFLGQALGVATEKALAAYGAGGARVRPLDGARVLMLPDDGFIPAEVQKGIDRLAREGVVVVRGLKGAERSLAKRFAEQAVGWNLPDVPRVRETESEKGVYGVESRGYRQNGKSYMTLVNHLDTPQKVRLERAGRDLITGAAVPAAFSLAPLTPMLIAF